MLLALLVLYMTKETRHFVSNEFFVYPTPDLFKKHYLCDS